MKPRLRFERLRWAAGLSVPNNWLEIRVGWTGLDPSVKITRLRLLFWRCKVGDE